MREYVHVLCECARLNGERVCVYMYTALQMA